MKVKIIKLIMNLFFYKSLEISFSHQEIDEYNRIYNDAIDKNGLIEYSTKFPKQRFIQYIANNKDVLLHGSSNKNISVFEPKRQTLYNGKYVDAVFATKDGIWPLFYAVLDRNKMKGSIRNACLEIRGGNKYYFFSITRESYLSAPWTTGMIYFLPATSFKKASHEIVSFDEWISVETVIPIARLEVDPEDFYFKDRVTTHKVSEHIIITWLLYKLRNRFKRYSKRQGNDI